MASNGSLDESVLTATNSGMCALWDVSSFEEVTDLSTWEDLFDNDESLVRLMDRGVFVPLNVGGSGTFQVNVRDSGLTARESAVLLVSSEPYLLRSNGRVALGGIEYAGSYIGGAFEMALAEGSYAVTVHLIDWKAEPGSVDRDGNPVAGALPDFVVVVSSILDPANGEFRRDVSTFSRN